MCSFQLFLEQVQTLTVCWTSKLRQLPENLQITLNEPQLSQTRSQQHARPEAHVQTVPETRYCSCFWGRGQEVRRFFFSFFFFPVSTYLHKHKIKNCKYSFEFSFWKEVMLMADVPSGVCCVHLCGLSERKIFLLYIFSKRKITYLKTENYMQVSKKSRLVTAKYSEVSV